MKKRFSEIVWGIVLVVIGLILLGKFLGLYSFDIFFDGWWTLLIIIPSIIDLFFENHKSTSLTFLIIGILLLLASRDYVSYTSIFKIFICLVLIISGIKMIFKSGNKPKIKQNKDIPVYTGIFGGIEEKYSKNKFKGCKIISVFGGSTIDLREAKIDEDCIVEVVSIFGGSDLIIPDNVNVVVSGVALFGGCDNKKNNQNDNKVTIYVEQVSIFGGLDIK